MAEVNEHRALDTIAHRLIDAAIAAGLAEAWGPIANVRNAGGSWITAHVRRLSVRASHREDGVPPPYRIPTIGEAPPLDADLYAALEAHLAAIAVYLPPSRPMFVWEGDVVNLRDLRAAMRDRLPVADAWVAMVWRLAADGFGLRTR